MLKVENLSAGYGGSTVLHHVSLRVEPGEAVVILGPNGHGKTTLLRAISALIRPYTGRVEFGGSDLTGKPPHVAVAAGIVHIPQGDLIFPGMTVNENLLMGAYRRESWHGSRQRLAKIFALFPRLEHRQSQLAGSLSGGERRMLAIGRGLMGNARLLLMDEPSLGLAPRVIDEIYAAIQEMKAQGQSLLLVEENVDHASGLADRIYLLESGVLVREGPTADLLSDQALLNAYLT